MYIYIYAYIYIYIRMSIFTFSLRWGAARGVCWLRQCSRRAVSLHSDQPELIYIYICVYIYIYVFTYTYLQIYVYIKRERWEGEFADYGSAHAARWVYTQINQIYIYVYMYTYIYIYIFVYSHIHIYKYMYVCIYYISLHVMYIVTWCPLPACDGGRCGGRTSNDIDR